MFNILKFGKIISYVFILLNNLFYFYLSIYFIYLLFIQFNRGLLAKNNQSRNQNKLIIKEIELYILVCLLLNYLLSALDYSTEKRRKRESKSASDVTLN